MLWLGAARHGGEQAKQVVFISEGVGWIKGVHATHFPQALDIPDQSRLDRALRAKLGTEQAAIPAMLEATGIGPPTPSSAPSERSSDRYWAARQQAFAPYAA